MKTKRKGSFVRAALAIAAIAFVGFAQAASFYTQPATSPASNGGVCYVSSSATESTGSYTSDKSSKATIKRNNTGYLYAFPNFGYKFVGWNTSATTTYSYDYTDSRASFKAGSDATYYAHFATCDEAEIKDIYLANDNTYHDSVQLYFYNDTSIAWSARVNTTFLNNSSSKAVTVEGTYASCSFSCGNQSASTSFSVTVTAKGVSGTSYDELTIQDYEGHVYHYRIHVIAARSVIEGESTNCVVNSFASKAWTVDNTASTGYLSGSVTPTTASTTATATITGLKVSETARLISVKNYVSATTTGALGATYNFYVTVKKRPMATYYAAVASEVVDQDETLENGIGWTYASCIKKEESNRYQTIRSHSGTFSAEVQPTEPSATIDGFYIFAFPNPGYRFAGWTLNRTDGAYVSTDPFFDTSLSVTATSTDKDHPTVDTYYAHFEKDDTRMRDITLAVGDSVNLSFYNAEKAYTWSFQALWTNETAIVKEQVLNLDGTETGLSDYLAYTRSHDNETPSNGFTLNIQALNQSGHDFDQLTIEDCKGNVYHYRIHVTNPRIVEKGETISFEATSYANQSWSISNVNVAVASAQLASSAASDAVTVTSTGVKKGQMTFKVGNYAPGTATGPLGADYSFEVNVVEPWPVDFCQGDSVTIYYHNRNPKTWYLLINGQRFEANEEGIGERMRVTLTADDPDTDTYIDGTTTNCVPDGTSDLVIVTDGDNFYAYRMGVWPRRVVEVGESVEMTCSTVSTNAWRVQVPSGSVRYVDVAQELNINGGHSAKVTLTGKEPKQDVIVYVGNFKDDGTVNAQGAYYVLVSDVKGAATRSAYISQGVTVTWGENYEFATGSTAYAVDPASSNKMTAAVARDGSTGVNTTLSVANDATFGSKALFTVTDGCGTNVVKYDVMAYVPMSMAVGQVAPGCLSGSPVPWVVWSSNPEKLDVSSVLYNQLYSGRVEAKAPGDFWLWATNASDTVTWYAMRAQVYDVATRTLGVPVGGAKDVQVSAQSGLAAVWTATCTPALATVALDSAAAVDSVRATITGGTEEGLCDVLVKNAYHQEKLVVYVGASDGQSVVLGGSLVLGRSDRPYLPSECSTQAWTAYSTDPAVVAVLADSGAAGTAVQLEGIAPGTARVVVKTASKITVYDVEVSKDVNRLGTMTVGVEYTLTTNLTDIAAGLAGATLRTTGDRMIAETSLSGNKLTIVGKQEGKTEVELATATTVYTLPINVYKRDITKKLTLYVGARGTCSTYSYTYDRYVSHVNDNPDRVDVSVVGNTITITPKVEGPAGVTVKCYVDGNAESSTITYIITIAQIGGGQTIEDFDQGFISYKDASRAERIGDDLLMVFDDPSKVGVFQVPDGYNAKMEILAVGGGGGGGSVATGFGRGGGGGGGGGFTLLENKLIVGGTYGVQVGEGGMAIEGSITGLSERGAPGGSSVITNSYGYVMAMGNGGGGGGAPREDQYAGEDGGSGGGGSWIRDTDKEGVLTWVPGRGGLGVSGQGFGGGTPTETNCGGGGGGAGGVGGDGQTRGAGRYSSITGSSVLYSLGGFGGRSDVATPAADGQGPGFGGDGGNGGPGGDGTKGVVALRIHRIYRNVLVPVPTTNDLVTARFLWEEGTNCVPFVYSGRSFRSKTDQHIYNWDDVIDTVSGVTNVVCEYGGEGGTNKIGVGYYSLYVTLKEGFAWENGDDLYGSTKKMTYRWVVVEDWSNIDAAIEMNKTVWWSDKSNATIRVVSRASPETSGGGVPNVLFLGTLCSAHSLKNTTIAQSLNAIASIGTVDYYMYVNESCKNSGHLDKGGTVTASQFTLESRGAHYSLNAFYTKIREVMVTGTNAYDYIVMEFDGSRIAYRYDDPDYYRKFDYEAEVASVLKSMYDEEKVIWIVDDGNEQQSGQTHTEPFSPYWRPNTYFFSGAVSASQRKLTASQYQGLVGLFCPSNYSASADYELLSTESTTSESLVQYANPFYPVQAYYNDPSAVTNLLYSAIKVKPFNLFYKDKIVQPAAGLTIQEVSIEVCTKTVGGQPSTNAADWAAIRHWDAKTGEYYDDDPTHATGIQGSSMWVDTTNNLVVAVLSNVSFQVWVRYDTHVVDADGVFCSDEDAKYNEVTGQYEKNPNDGQAYLAMIDELGVGIGAEGDAETSVPWRYTAYPIVGSAQNGSIFIAGTRSSQMSCAEGRDITVYYRGNGGYRLAALTVDGVSVEVGKGYDNSYTFYNLSCAHTISVVYTPYYGTVTPVNATNEYDGAAHVPAVVLKGWDETYSTQIRYSLTEDGEYYTEAEFRELYATNRDVTCVGDHVIFCRAYAWQSGYGERLDEPGWVWVDTRVVERGVFTITPKPLAMTAVSFLLKGDEVPDPPLNQWRGVTVDGLVAGDTVNTNETYLTFSCPTYQKAEGQYPILPVKTDGTTDFDIVGINYTLTLLPGVVSIEKGPMIVGGVHQFAGLDPENPLVNTGVARVEKIYDGLATNLVLDITEPAAGDRRVLYSYDDGATWTDVEEPQKFFEVGTNKVWYAIEQGKDYESSIYFWVTNYNYVIIDRRPITIRAASATKRYDTLPLTTNGYELVSGTLAEGDGLYRVEVTGSQTVVGTSANVAANADIRLTNNALGDPAFRTADYDITYEDGTLTVTPASIMIGDVVYDPGATVVYGETGVSDVEKTYDGLGTNITVTVTQPASGYSVYYSTNGMKDAQIQWSPQMSFTNAGAYAVHFLVEADNYASVTNFAYVKINPRGVTVTVQDNWMKLGTVQPDYTAVYTFTDNGAKVPDEIASAFVFSLSVTNENIVVGTCDIVAQGEKVQGNYAFTCVPGTLTVTDKDFIGCSTTDLDVDYDGKGHSPNPVVVDVSVTGKVTVVYALSPEGPWSETLPVFTNATTGAAVYYKVNSDAGTYLEATGTYFVKINPLPLTVTANPAEMFDKDVLPPLTATVTGTFAEGEGTELISYSLSVSSTALGTNEVVVTGLPLQGNYTVVYANAPFVVKDWSYPAGPEKEPIPIDREWIQKILGTNDLNYATATNFYYSEGENGVTNWVNYVLGLDPTNYESVIYLDMTPDLLDVSNATFFVQGIYNRLTPPIGSITNITFELLQCDTPTGRYERVTTDDGGIFPRQQVPIKFYRANTIIEFRK